MIVFVCGIKPFCCYFTIFFGVDQGHLRAPAADGSGATALGAGRGPAAQKEIIHLGRENLL